MYRISKPFEEIAQPEVARPLRYITMVGAYRVGERLGDTDEGYLKKVFSICAAQQIPVDPAPVVTVCNLDYGKDFLREPPASDMVVFSYIFYDKMLASIARLPQFVRQSSLIFEDGIWHQSLSKSGARVAVNVYEKAGENELPTALLNHAPFSRFGQYQFPDINRNMDLLLR